jgi:hypothetical protein
MVFGMHIYASSPAEGSRDRADLSRSACVFYFAGFFFTAWYAFHTNFPCLFFDSDGVAWAVVINYFEQR